MKHSLDVLIAEIFYNINKCILVICLDITELSVPDMIIVLTTLFDHRYLLS